MADIATPEVQRFVLEKLKRGYAWETASHMRHLLSKVLGTAKDWRYLADNPVLGVAMPERILKRPHRALSIEEVRMLLSKMNEPERTITIVATLAGLRIGEILGLRWGRVHLDQCILEVEETCYKGVFGTPKSKASRRGTPLAPVVVQDLMATACGVWTLRLTRWCSPKVTTNRYRPTTCGRSALLLHVGGRACAGLIGTRSATRTALSSTIWGPQ